MAKAKSRVTDRTKALARTDGWANVLTGIGTSRDKRAGSGFKRDIIDPEKAEELWESDDTAARIIETIPEEMTREWIDINIEAAEGEPDAGREQSDEMLNRLEELGAQAAFNKALAMARAVGGAGILLGVDDAQDPTAPLDLKRQTDLRYLSVLSARELVPVAWYGDPMDPKCGLPEAYQVRPLVMRTVSGLAQVPEDRALPDFPVVHETRILRFEGIETTRHRRRYGPLPGWGLSILTRVNQVLTDFNLTWGGVANIMQDFSQAFLKVKGLAELIAQNEDQTVIKRAQMMDITRSVARMVLLDADEEFGRDTASLGGVDAVLEKFMLRLAAAARMPVSLLMGQAPSGLNATGDSDIRWFYDYVASQQRKVTKKPLSTLCSLLWNEAGGEPDKWHIEFKRLWQPTEAETVTMRAQQATADGLYIDKGVLLPEEVALARFGGDRWSAETKIDIELRKKMAESRSAMEEQKVATEHQQSIQNEKVAQQPPQPPTPPGAGKGAKKDAWEQQERDDLGKWLTTLNDHQRGILDKLGFAIPTIRKMNSSSLKTLKALIDASPGK
jgi:phage-related protein (TIGR01555 family)